MREILFRGKAVGSLKWVEGFYFRKAGNFIIELPSAVSTETHMVYEDTIGQYTGLTDKNGKKIYEGDIVKAVVNRYVYDRTDVREERGLIGYDAIGMLSLILYFHNDEPVCSDVFAELSLSSCVQDFHFEVIGNIHDNPELLKGGAE